MPIILKVERSSVKSILLYTILYLFLTIGALTMVYPFVLMVTGSFSSNIDKNEFRLMPSFLIDTESLYRKHIESKYNENLQEYLTINQSEVLNFSSITSPPVYENSLIIDWIKFNQTVELPTGWYLTALGPTQDGKIIQENERKFRLFIMNSCAKNLDLFREKFGDSIENWFFLKFHPERLTDRKYQLSQLPLMEAFYDFKQQLPLEDRLYVSCDGAYQNYINLITQTEQSTQLSQSYDGSDSWEQFVRTALHPQFIDVNNGAHTHWANFLTQHYEGSISALNNVYMTSYKSFVDVPFPDDKLRSSGSLRDYMLFIANSDYLDVNFLVLDSPEFRWRKFLQKKYGTIDKASISHGRNYSSFDTIKMPQQEFDWQYVQDNKFKLIKRYLIRNYQIVFDYIVLYGRGFYNTLIYCAFSIFLALLINPLAAYALSRYNLPNQYKILLFLIATMAFPAVVTMIPNFLLLRDLGLLNTFAALLLPGMANGYAIFLLKGFFDSLPRELYEAAELDGASEWTKFWLITMNLSKPILAVIALGAFNAAYSNFMYAFILCQDRDMWTLMVWLYQLQQFSGQGVVFASLIIAAIPTLLVFICFQNVILRGIVVPTEK